MTLSKSPSTSRTHLPYFFTRFEYSHYKSAYSRSFSREQQNHAREQQNYDRAQQNHAREQQNYDRAQQNHARAQQNHARAQQNHDRAQQNHDREQQSHFFTVESARLASVTPRNATEEGSTRLSKERESLIGFGDRRSQRGKEEESLRFVGKNDGSSTHKRRSICALEEEDFGQNPYRCQKEKDKQDQPKICPLFGRRGK